MAVSRIGLRGRLVAVTVAAALVGVAGLVLGLQALLAHQSTRDSLAVLRSRADAASTTVRLRHGRIRVLEVPSGPLDQNLWIYAVGRRVDGDRPPPRLRQAVHRLSEARSETSVEIGGRFRLLARPVQGSAAAPAAVVVAGLDLAPYESAERRGLWLSLGLGLLTVAAASAAAYVASGISLRQVRRMAHRADEWREHDLTGRFAMGTPHDELTELADTLDRMLDRIAQAILTERRLTDEVAHELRTPLTVIRSEAQLALLDGGADRPSAQALANIVSATHRMTSSIETMLTVARSAHADEQPCHPAEVLAHAREHLAVPAGVGVHLEPGPSDVVAAAPLHVVVAALGPLLDNAARHAQSNVRVHVTTDEHRVELHVEDDGAGVDEAQRAHVFEPGRSTGGGAGLGLGLSRRLAHTVGGEVDLRDDTHGHFVLSVPRG